MFDFKIKKLTVLAVVFSLILSCTGCNKNYDSVGPDEDSGKLKVVTTMFAEYDFVRQIAGDKADIKLLLAPGSEPHSYEPTPKDIVAIGECDLFIYVGGESDEWVREILDSVDNPNMKIIRLMDVVEVKREEAVNDSYDEDSFYKPYESELEAVTEAEEEEWDEHVWTSPANAILISMEITNTLKLQDFQNADYYEENAKDFCQKLFALDEEFKTTVDAASRRLVVFADRFPARYFTEEFGLEYLAAFPGCSSETEVSVAVLKTLVDKVRADSIPVVFKIELSNGNVADAVAEETGAEVYTFYSCHNITLDDFEAGLGYYDLMKKNLEALKLALN